MLFRSFPSHDMVGVEGFVVEVVAVCLDDLYVFLRDVRGECVGEVLVCELVVQRCVAKNILPWVLDVRAALEQWVVLVVFLPLVWKWFGVVLREVGSRYVVDLRDPRFEWCVHCCRVRDVGS